jgi:hypothetical protein
MQQQQQQTTTSNNNKQNESVCRFSGWPTASFCLTRKHTRIDKFVGHFKKTTNRSETGPYPSDLDGVGRNQNGKTCPVGSVMAPRPEKVERILFLSMFDSSYIKFSSMYSYIFSCEYIYIHILPVCVKLSC